MNNVIDISKRYLYEIRDSNNKLIALINSIGIDYAYKKFCRMQRINYDFLIEMEWPVKSNYMKCYKLKDCANNRLIISIHYSPKNIPI